VAEVQPPHRLVLPVKVIRKLWLPALARASRHDYSNRPLTQDLVRSLIWRGTHWSVRPSEDTVRMDPRPGGSIEILSTLIKQSSSKNRWTTTY